MGGGSEEISFRSVGLARESLTLPRWNTNHEIVSDVKTPSTNSTHDFPIAKYSQRAGSKSTRVSCEVCVSNAWTMARFVAHDGGNWEDLEAKLVV
jgi:hypothetical protein